MFNNLSFRIKLVVPLIIIGLGYLVIAGIGITSNSQVVDSVNVITRQYLPATAYLLEADRDLYQALTAERSFIFLEVGTDEYNNQVKQHDENIIQAKQRVEKFAQLIQTEQVQAMVAKFRTLFADWESVTRRIEKERTEGGRIGRRTAIELTFGEASEKFGAMRDVIDQLTEVTGQAAGLETQYIDTLSDNSRNMQVVALVIGVGITALLAFLFPALITRPINRLLLRVDDISRGEGDLTARLEVNSRDEIGKLGDAFNRFIEKLHSIMGNIAGSTAQLAAASEELSLITADSAHHLQQQHSATEQVATAVNEMSATVQEVARNASNAASCASDADTNVQQGQQVVQQTITAIKDLARDVDAASSVIRELNSNSESIGKVLDVIKGIAEQTNLLALNAAIEAARAGEQGRGFAVVADEVRTLASRTQASTKEIHDMIQKLQEGATNAVRVMDNGCSKAQTTVELAENAGKALRAITLAVAEISQMNIQIATAAEEQNAVTEDINRNVIEISNASDSTAQSASQIESASSNLAMLAANLQQQVDQFRI